MKPVEYLPLISRKESCKLAVKDICYVYRTNRRLNFQTDMGLKTVYEKIEDVEKYLGPEFCRCKSGCIVNMAKIIDMRDGTVYFEDGRMMSLGREAFVKLKQRFNAYILGLLTERDDKSREGSDYDDDDENIDDNDDDFDE